MRKNFFASNTPPIFFLCTLVLLSLHFGSSDFGLMAFWKILVAELRCLSSCTVLDSTARIIFYDIRLPRTMIAAGCGGALAAAGVLSQGLFRNALASPSILGTSTGGSFFAVLAFYWSSELYLWYTLPIAAFSGAMLVTAFVILLAHKRLIAATDRLLLAGFAVNTFFGALTSFIIFLLLEEHLRVANALHWLFGGFGGKTWQHVPLLVLPCTLGIVLGYRICARLNVLSLTEDVARSLSVNTTHLRYLAIIAIALLVGSTVAVAGGLPFIGLMIPHVCRFFYGAEHRNLLTKSIINGMSFTLLMDILTRIIGGVREIDVGIITALIGGLFFLVVLIKNNRQI